jgi:hypothetical protein
MSEYRRAESLRRRLPELLELETLRLAARGVAEVTVEEEIQLDGLVLPIYSFAFGAADPELPRIAFVGGVHGLERVGTNIAISYLKTLLELIQWDMGLQHLLDRCRVLFLPLVNPAGMFAMTRANANGVDLMRNAPVEADTRPNIALVGGHRISPRLPWFRGHVDAPMEKEAVALVRFLRRELLPARFSIALDLHSGFGLVDRLWFPFAYTKTPFDRLDLMYALKLRLDRSLPNHFYLMEPQSAHYVTHGDLWDYVYLEHRKTRPDHALLPLTLEMGSWLWIKKNPRQVFSSLGIFNPMIPHRLQRTLRRHLALLDFLVRAAVSHDNWARRDLLVQGRAEMKARSLWFSSQGKTPLR